MSEMLVTVVMATYNQATYIRQALESLRGQTLPRGQFEVIVINDGSTDGTSGILREYAGWIRLIEREHRGLATSCNEGLAAATGLYFGRLDSDDMAAPGWLATLVQALGANPDACCAYPDRYEIVGDRWEYVSANAGNLYSLLACGPLFATGTLQKVGGFRPFYWEEYDLYLRLRQAAEFIHVARPLYVYRRHPESMTSDVSRRVAGWLELAKEWGIETLESAGFDPVLGRALRLMRTAGGPR